MPAIVCVPWCEDGDGHTSSLVRADQTCWGPASYVDLSLEEVIHDSSGVYVPRVGAMAWGRGTLRVRPSRRHQGAPNRGGDDALDDSVHMTADEAVRLAIALLKAAEDARTGR
jgi:hypothetical protein